jgi:hypothetical protein
MEKNSHNRRLIQRSAAHVKSCETHKRKVLVFLGSRGALLSHNPTAHIADNVRVREFHHDIELCHKHPVFLKIHNSGSNQKPDAADAPFAVKALIFNHQLRSISQTPSTCSETVENRALA